MTVPIWVWAVSIAALVVVAAGDLALSGRGAPTMRSAAAWAGFYLSLAGVFAVGLFLTVGAERGTEFVAGYLTEYSLSVDNLFVFYLVLARMAVPPEARHRALLIGISLALVMRGLFILAGAAALSRFEWLFFVFGAFLLYTAWSMARGRPEPDPLANPLVRTLRRVMPVSADYAGLRMITRVGERWSATPLLVVVVSLGTIDLLFALDSIPAIFGLTREPYLIFMANAFALLGLRQLYVLLAGLLETLAYLTVGLTVILAFIGVKLILHAAHTTWSSAVPTVSTAVSLGVIAVTLATAIVASLVRARAEESR